MTPSESCPAPTETASRIPEPIAVGAAAVLGILCAAAWMHGLCWRVYPLIPALGSAVAALALHRRGTRATLLAAVLCGLGTGSIAGPSDVSRLPYWDPYVQGPLVQNWAGTGLREPLLAWSLAGALVGSLGVVALLRLCESPEKRDRWVSVLCGLLVGAAMLNLFLFPMRFNPGFVQACQTEPGEHYQNDGRMLLKVYFLQRQGGLPFYPAFARAFALKQGGLPTSALDIRMPYLFTTWALLCPDASAIHLAYRLLACLSLLCLYLIACRLVAAPAALLPVFLLAADFALGAITPFYVYTEYWSTFLVIPAVLAAAYGRHGVAALLFLVGVLFREQAVLGLIGLATLVTCGQGWRKALPWWLALATFAGLEALHLHAAAGWSLGGVTTRSWNEAGLPFLSRSVLFGSDLLPARPFIVWAVAAMAATGLALLPTWRARLPFVALCLVPVLAFSIVGRLASWYWGQLYLPWLMVLAACALCRVFPPLPMADAPGTGSSA